MTNKNDNIIKFKKYINITDLQEVIQNTKFKTLVLSGIDSDGSTITHVMGAENTVLSDYCFLLKMLEVMLYEAMIEL